MKQEFKVMMKINEVGFLHTDNTDVVELKSFLDVNFSPVFHIFYEAFITFESNLKQKGKF